MIQKRIFILCGEASGDLHAANLVKAWKKTSSDFTFKGWGGDRLQSQGVEILKPIKELSFMGFWEVIKNIKTILKNFKTCKQQLLEFKPEAIVLVDFPGFNLRIAQWAKNNGIKVIYYISPQIWAWKKGRIKKIKRYVDHMFCILPFEPEFYSQFNYPVVYEGHPLLDEIESFSHVSAEKSKSETPIIAILPGSRLQEVQRKLPIMLRAALKLEGYSIVVACSNQVDPDFYRLFENPKVDFVFNNTYSVLKSANLALVTSGTATLETALFDVPQVVCYKSSPISIFIAKLLVNIEYISLVNLILNRPLLTELIQEKCNEERMYQELLLLVEGQPKREEILKGYSELRGLLGNSGASERIAQKMIETFKE